MLKYDNPIYKTDFSVKVKLDVLLAVLEAASKEATRYYLNGVHITVNEETGAPQLVATDGHILVVHQLPVPETGPVALPKDIILSTDAIRRLKYNGLLAREIPLVDIEITNKAVSVLFGSAVEISVPANRCYIDGNFPAWRLVVPNAAKEPVAADVIINPKLALRVMKISERLTGLSTCGTVEFVKTGPHAPAFLKTRSKETLIIVMPMSSGIGAYDVAGVKRNLNIADLPPKPSA